MINLPSQQSRQWSQPNTSDFEGMLAGSFGLNLTDKHGVIKVSPRMVITTDGITNFGCPVAFKMFYNSGDANSISLYTVGGSGVFYTKTSPLLKTAFVQDDHTGVVPGTDVSSDYSDMDNFNYELYVSGKTTYFYYLSSAGVWTKSASVLTSGYPHKILPFTKLNRLYIQSNPSTIISLDASHTVASSGSYTFALTQNTDSYIISKLQTSTLIWILTLNVFNATGYVYTWDGITANTPTDIIPLDSRGALAGIVKDGTPYIMDAEGRLLYYNGGAFVPVLYGQLPVKKGKYLKNYSSLKNDKWIHPNGMTLVNGKINILIDNYYDDGGNPEEFLPSGMWEFDPSIGWYHKAPLSLYSVPSGSSTIVDYGQNQLARVGALTNIKFLFGAATSGIVGTIMAGADYRTPTLADHTIKVSASWTDDSLDTIQKHGYAITSKISSSNLRDSWRGIYLRVKNLLSATDSVTIKYRVIDEDIPGGDFVTWLDSTHFYTTAILLDDSNIGDEVEGLSAQGSGKTAHITAVQPVDGTRFLVTLDETLGASSTSGVSTVRFQHWKRLGSFTDQDESLASFPAILEKSAWVQLKICMLFTGNDEIYDIIIDNIKNQ